MEELGINNKQALHREQRKFGEEVIQDLLVRLDSYIKEIDKCKVSSVEMTHKMNKIIDSALGNQDKDEISSPLGLYKQKSVVSLKPEVVFNQYMPQTSKA